MPKGEKKAGGRPKKVKHYSEQVKKNWMKAAAKIAKEMGMTFEEYLLRLTLPMKCPLCEGTGIFSKEEQKLCKACRGTGQVAFAQDTSIVGIAKIYNEALLIKESEHTLNDKRTGPQIGLPPPMPHPKEEKPQEEQRLHG